MRRKLLAMIVIVIMIVSLIVPAYAGLGSDDGGAPIPGFSAGMPRTCLP